MTTIGDNRYRNANVYRRDVLSAESSLEPQTRLVLIALCERADGSCYCYPSQVLISKDTGLDRRTVRKHLKLAEERGWLKSFPGQRRKGRAWTYTAYILQDQAEREQLCPRVAD